VFDEEDNTNLGMALEALLESLDPKQEMARGQQGTRRAMALEEMLSSVELASDVDRGARDGPRGTHHAMFVILDRRNLEAAPQAASFGHTLE
jgi:hypothetical protein